ncbi:GntR family transcriptional regulator [Amycolatopsis thermophila]|uniref:DNA-binding GntR family transcriptional regulator n=1 Tax=Amycolatopsis thermophila TaxID=206084 RepID=A0ABU0F4Q8_9PSEU|nr:GntR family transcriptional regulator [Amycolatopsis thermophila]MDQ0382564.1 DNA-binding GntR family transcriptional regulator [Amycolatopsis thermophila]
MTENVMPMRGRGPARQQLPEEVASYVRELIISGEVRPGEFLRLEPIAEAVGVSNTPVREGLLSLRSEGFVELVPRRGFVVAPFTEQDVRDLFWTQAQLAGELTARAARKITADGMARLEANVDEFTKASAEGREDRVAELGHQFHREINLAADSHRLARLLNSVVKHLPNRFYAEIEGTVTGSQEAHPLILEAIRKRAARKAQSLMAEHILDSGEHLVEMLRKRGVWAETSSA